VYRAVLGTKGGWGGSRGGESGANPQLLIRSELGRRGRVLQDKLFVTSHSLAALPRPYQPITYNHEISPTKCLSALAS